MARTVIARSGHGVRKGLRRSGPGKCLVLLIERLGDGRDSRIADPLPDCVSVDVGSVSVLGQAGHASRPTAVIASPWPTSYAPRSPRMSPWRGSDPGIRDSKYRHSEPAPEEHRDAAARCRASRDPHRLARSLTARWWPRLRPHRRRAPRSSSVSTRAPVAGMQCAISRMLCVPRFRPPGTIGSLLCDLRPYWLTARATSVRSH